MLGWHPYWLRWIRPSCPVRRGTGKSGQLVSQNQLTAFAQLEADLWVADQLRANSNQTPAEYSMPVLGVIFLRYPHAQEPNRTISRRFHMSPAIPGIKEVPSYWNGGMKWVSLADSDKFDRIYISETDKAISDLGI